MAVLKRKIILPVVILLVAVLLAAVLGSMRPPPNRETPVRPAVLVEVMTTQKQAETFSVPAQGNVMPRFQTSVVSEVSGRILEVSPRLVAGGFFSEGEVMLTVDPADYQAELEEAKANLARAQSAVAQERALGRVAEAEWRSIEAGEIPELGLRQPQLASELANLRSAEARLMRAERNLERTQVRAPFDGVLATRNVNLGQFISMNTVVGTLFGTELAEIRVPLTDYDLSFLDMAAIDAEQDGGPTVNLRANVAGQTLTWQGAIVRTEGIVDSSSRVTYGVIEVKDTYNRKLGLHNQPLTFGRYVIADIEGITVPNLIRLPRYAVNVDGKVWVVTDERILEARPVTVYRSAQNDVYISEGLESGERVMLTQLDNPLPGMRVRLPGDPLAPAEPETENDSDTWIPIQGEEGEQAAETEQAKGTQA